MSITLRANLEAALAGRVPEPFVYRDRKIVDTAPCGIPAVDSLLGGLPRGSLTEICGPSCSGRTSLLFSALAARTAQLEACALVDGRDAFDPQSAEAAGVDLNNLLWVRCRDLDQSLAAADLLLHNGGFGLVALDLSDFAARKVRHIPLNAWFRFRRTVEYTPTIFLVLEQEPNAQASASLVLEMGMDSVQWSMSAGAGCTCMPLACRPDRDRQACSPGAAVETLQLASASEILDTAKNFGAHPLARLLAGFRAQVQVLRSRVKQATEMPRERKSFAGNRATFKQVFVVQACPSGSPREADGFSP